MGGALSHIRVCDFTGQLAGAGATRWMAACGAQIIRIEDPVAKGRWDILRGAPPFKDERRGIEFGAGFQNHNVEKLGVTLNLRTERGKELLAELVKISDVVSENFSAGVMDRLGFGYPQLRELREDIVYVSNSGFGLQGPYGGYKSWGPIAQAVSGLTFNSGLPGEEPAGWGYSYMDHTGGYYMAMAILGALYHRARTGEGQWVDLSCTEAGATLNGPTMLDYTVNGRPLRRDGAPNTNRATQQGLAPHGAYPCAGDDDWVAIACRHDDDWAAIAAEVDADWATAERFRTMAGRLAAEDELDSLVETWTRGRGHYELAAALQARGVPAAAVARPGERIDEDPNTAEWGLWPTVVHREMGDVRVDGYPVHFSGTDWRIEASAPCLGEHTDAVFGDLLGLSAKELDQLRGEGVI
ncbi:MAG: CoA transferase [Acidimicrobiia bacterium]|nr:CoA transferase [Acidimicrobiia bacterium]